MTNSTMCSRPTMIIICFSFLTMLSSLATMTCTVPLAFRGAPKIPAASTRPTVSSILLRPPRITILSTMATPVDSV